MTASQLEAPNPDLIDQSIPVLSDRRRTFVLATMCLALVLVVAGVTMLTNGLPMIASDLELSQTEQTWVVDSYALPFAALLLIAGALGDRYGRRGALHRRHAALRHRCAAVDERVERRRALRLSARSRASAPR